MHNLTDWFARLRKPVRQFLHRRAPAILLDADLEDVAQETFLRVLRYTDDSLVRSPQTYLFSIANNVALEWAERSRYRKPHLPVHLLPGGADTSDDAFAELLADDDRSPEAVCESEQARALVAAAVDQLPARQRTLLLLHVNEGLTYRQIAGRERVSERVVLRDLRKAYAALRVRLQCS